MDIARALSFGTALGSKEVIYLNGHLVFNYDALADMRAAALPSREDGPLEVEEMYRYGTPKPRGRLNIFMVSNGRVSVSLYAGDEEYSPSDKLWASGIDDDIFWTPGNSPWPAKSRLDPFAKLKPGLQAKNFLREFENYKLTYCLIDNRIVEKLVAIPGQPITAYFFNDDEIMHDALDVPDSVTIQRDKRMPAAGGRIFFTNNELAEWAADELTGQHSW